MRTKTRVSTPATVTQHSSEVLAMTIREERKRQESKLEKKENSVFADDTILHRENPKDATRILLDLINESSKIIGYNINTSKSLAFLYTNNKVSEREIKEIIPFTIDHCNKKNKIHRDKPTQGDKRPICRKQ